MIRNLLDFEKILKIWQKSRKKINAVGLLLGCLVFFWQVFKSLKAFGQVSFDLIHPNFLGLALASAIFAYLLQIWIWQRIMQALGFRLPFSKLATGYYLNFLPRYIPGTIWGYASRNEWMNQAFQVKWSSTNYASFIEILAPISASVTIAGYFFFKHSTSLFTSILALILCIAFPLITWGGLSWLSSTNVAKNLWFKFSGSELPKLRLQDWLILEIIYIVQLTFLGCVILFTLFSFSAPSSFFSFDPLISSVFAYSASWSVGFIILFVPGGIGVREALMSTLVTQYLEVTPTLAIIIALADRLILLVTEFILMSFSIIPFIRRIDRKKAK